MEDFWYIQCVFKLYFQSAFNVAPLSIILLFVDIYRDHYSFIEYRSIQNLFSLPPPPGGFGEGGGVGWGGLSCTSKNHYYLFCSRVRWCTVRPRPMLLFSCSSFFFFLSRKIKRICIWHWISYMFYLSWSGIDVLLEKWIHVKKLVG